MSDGYLQGVDLCHSKNGLRIAPETLEPVVLPLGGCENVHDNISAVQQHPARRRLALYSRWLLTFFLELCPEITYYRIQLARGLPRANHEVVRDIGQLADIYEQDITAHLLHDKVNDPSRQFQ